MTQPSLEESLAAMPLIAILRGLEPERARDVGRILVESGFRILEVPLNSPAPLSSLRVLAESFGDRALIGAGTVLRAEDAAAVAEAGGRLVVMPHADRRIIAAVKRAGVAVMPGVATPSEGFAAIDAGADALKLFPAESIPPAVVKAWRAVFPASIRLLPVGGITSERLAAYWQAGASGFGVGSSLFQPGVSLDDLAKRAVALVAAMGKLLGGHTEGLQPAPRSTRQE